MSELLATLWRDETPYLLAAILVMVVVLCLGLATGRDDPTDSAVRCHLLATLQRNGWHISIPDQSVHLVQEDEAHRKAA